MPKSSVEQTNEQVARDARQKRREARDRDVAARRAEIQRDPELVRLQSGIRTWLFNGISRDFSSWKIGHVDNMAAFRRMAEFLRQPEEKVWEDIVDQFNDDQAGSAAA